MESISRREQALALFHLMGKVLYNKRLYSQVMKSCSDINHAAGKGDPLSTAASAKDKHREQELDANLRIPPPLPHIMVRRFHDLVASISLPLCRNPGSLLRKIGVYQVSKTYMKNLLPVPLSMSE